MGSRLVGEIIKNTDLNVCLVLRPKGRNSVKQRLRAVIASSVPDRLKASARKRVMALKGDITLSGLGLGKDGVDFLLPRVEAVYHCAADCDFDKKLADIRRVNVLGTENVLALSESLRKRGRLRLVNHISTVFIAGNYRGLLREDERDLGQEFNNTYELSKYEAELAVERFREKGLSVNIFRPSIIIGNTPGVLPSGVSISDATKVSGEAGGILSSETAADKRIMPTVARLLKLCTSGVFDRIPAREGVEFNMVPVDFVARAISIISNRGPCGSGMNYHIVNPFYVKLTDILERLENLFGIKRPVMIPCDTFKRLFKGTIKYKIAKRFIPYLNQDLKFSMKNTEGDVSLSYNLFNDNSLQHVLDQFIETAYNIPLPAGR